MSEKQEMIAKLEVVLDMLKGSHELPRANVQIDPEVLEIVKRNQMPDQNGFAHPNAGIFRQIEAELKRLCALANGGEPVRAGLPVYQYQSDDNAKTGPEMEKLQSSNVDSFGYTHTTQTLRVKFTNGDVYDYEQVPPEIAEGLRSAQSPGGFLAAHVKGSFKYKKL